jgi:two-component system, NarL family, invasion response regulator UvrY
MLSINSINIALADDHHLFRKMLRQILQGFGHTVSIEATNGKALIEMLNFIPMPDLCVLDVNMPVMDGVQTAGYIVQHFPQVKVLLCTMNTEIHSAIKYRRLHVAGTISKFASVEEFDATIKRVLNLG